jgi:hypothetical protein
MLEGISVATSHEVFRTGSKTVNCIGVLQNKQQDRQFNRSYGIKLNSKNVRSRMNKTKASVCKGKEYGTFKTVPVNK